MGKRWVGLSGGRIVEVDDDVRRRLRLLSRCRNGPDLDGDLNVDVDVIIGVDFDVDVNVNVDVDLDFDVDSPVVPVGEPDEHAEGEACIAALGKGKRSTWADEDGVLE